MQYVRKYLHSSGSSIVKWVPITRRGRRCMWSDIPGQSVPAGAGVAAVVPAGLGATAGAPTSLNHTGGATYQQLLTTSYRYKP